MKTQMKIGMMVAGALGALVLAGLGPARCQGNPALTLQYPGVSKGITAQGHGEVKVKPDIALVTITVTTQSTNQAEAVSQNAVKSTTVLAALRDAGIAEKDIETQSYTVQPQYDYNVSPAVRTGYQVQNSVQATVRDLTKVGLVIDKTTAGGASEIGGVTFDLSDKGAAESAALAQAVASAKQKADVMASAAGVGLGRLLTMTEGGSEPVIRPVYAMRAMSPAAQSPATPINDQQITVDADATLVYAMGEAK